MYESVTDLNGINVVNGNINLNKAYVDELGGWGVATTMNIDNVFYIQLFFSSTVVAKRQKKLSTNAWGNWNTH